MNPLTLSGILRCVLLAAFTLVGGTLLATEDPALPWQVSFSYRETPPNPGGGAPETIINLVIERDGQCRINYQVTDFQDQKGRTATWTGKLDAQQLARIHALLQQADLPSIKPAKVTVGRSGIEDGWGGKFTLTNAATHSLAFATHPFDGPDPHAKALLPAISFLKQLAESQTKD